MGLFDGVWMNVLNRQRVVSLFVSQVHSARALLASCFVCSEKGWRDCNRFRPGVLAVTMLCSACWSSASARRDKARHCLFLRMSGGVIPLTTGSMKVGVDRMHPHTSRRPLFRAASSRCVWALRHHTGEQYSAGENASANRQSKSHRALTFIEI